jgi:hypothetical protein
MIALAADENLNEAIVTGLRLFSDVDITPIKEAGLRGMIDPDVLNWAAQQGRILVPHDVQTMVGFAWDRIAANQRTPGLIVCPHTITIGGAIDDLLLIARCGLPEDYDSQVIFLPLK